LAIFLCQIQSTDSAEQPTKQSPSNATRASRRVIERDFLHADLSRITDGKLAVIGNFPYNISTQIVFKVLEERQRIPEMVGMFQKEVADRICAPPGSRTYGITSVLAQAWYDCEPLFIVEPGSFIPPPKVRSAVIRLRSTRRLMMPFRFASQGPRR